MASTRASTRASTSRIKPEPIDEDAIYCRCCFKLITLKESADSETENLFKMFEEIICLALKESDYASFFCFACSEAISSFSQFKKLATLKQEKFTEILRNKKYEDISGLFAIKLKSDPLTLFIKEEKESVSKLIYDDDYDDEHDYEDNDEPMEHSQEQVNMRSCPICSKEVDDLIEHLQSCNGKQCDECRFRTVDADEMKKHKRAKHGLKNVQKSEKAEKVDKTRVKKEVSLPKPKIFQCDVCGRILLNKGAMVAHLSKHMIDKPLKCKMCSYSTTFLKYLKNHTKKMHDPYEEGQKPSGVEKCKECNKKYKNLKAHYERVHAGIKNFQCEECGVHYYNKNGLKSHMEYKHNPLSSAELTKFVCETCGRGFAREHHLKSHKQTHLIRTLDFSCDHCEKKFPSKARVEDHIKCSHLRIMDNECDVCGKRFFKITKLKLHYNVHLGIKFYCFVEGCRAKRSRRDAIIYHMKNDHQLCNAEKEQFMKKLNDVCAQIKKR